MEIIFHYFLLFHFQDIFTHQYGMKRECYRMKMDKKSLESAKAFSIQYFCPFKAT